MVVLDKHDALNPFQWPLKLWHSLQSAFGDHELGIWVVRCRRGSLGTSLVDTGGEAKEPFRMAVLIDGFMYGAEASGSAGECCGTWKVDCSKRYAESSGLECAGWVRLFGNPIVVRSREELVAIAEFLQGQEYLEGDWDSSDFVRCMIAGATNQSFEEADLLLGKTYNALKIVAPPDLFYWPRTSRFTPRWPVEDDPVLESLLRHLEMSPEMRWPCEPV